MPNKRTEEQKAQRRAARLVPGNKETAYTREYESRPDIKAKRLEYRFSDARKEARKRYQRKPETLAKYKAYREQNIVKARAREAVNRALRTGEMTKGACSMASPFCKGPLDGHHHLGYDPGHWLDVVWLCRKHHVDLHKSEAESIAATRATTLSSG